MVIYTLQIFTLLLFAAAVYIAIRRRELWLLALATIYAAFFENLDVVLSQGQNGGYFYDPRLLLIIIETPLFIILSWGVIFYSAYFIARGLSDKFWAQAITVPLLILIIDLPLDPVATRLGLWTWIGYGTGEGIVGVPISNFIGWYLVILAFMISLAVMPHIRFLGRVGKYLIIPPLSFVIFILFFTIYNYFASFAGILPENEINALPLFLALTAFPAISIWIFLGKTMKITREQYFACLGIRIFFYVFSLWGLFVFSFWQEPVFLALFIFSAVVELFANIKFIQNTKFA